MSEPAITLTVAFQLTSTDSLVMKITPADAMKMIPVMTKIQARRSHRAFERFR